MSEQHPHPPVSVLGLGTMGTALATALLGAGHPVTVWNRTQTKADPVVAGGAARAADAAEAVRAGEIVLTCLLDHTSVHDVLDAHTGALAGRVLVNVTNTTPEESAELAAWTAGHGIDFLDGGIMAVPPQIGTHEAFVLYSGSRRALDTARTALAALGDVRYLGTDPGMAALQDMALLSAMYGMYGGILHAFALVRTGGVSAREFAPVLARWLGGAGGLAVPTAEQIDAADYARDVTSNVTMQAAAYDGLCDLARARGVDPLLLEPFGGLLRRRVTEGHGHEDATGVIDYLTTTTSPGEHA
ncbi:NAD(P)-dependent oxidoreductase [Saccharomonospora piscinae]|uniref:NAD(P)-dependent oxidoreductase n=1 Tax=Saccharomonospora piscinae TaxID=687388 RepID=UPI00110660D0|nr:NAD(P)-binding domain-containing protein [Saccharomonospora piscinae]TLW94575.1 NAD(P)-dependent oxidoreductase [Saccharomonospora piscinae]